jgi:hypothetical protein
MLQKSSNMNRRHTCTQGSHLVCQAQEVVDCQGLSQALSQQQHTSNNTQTTQQQQHIASDNPMLQTTPCKRGSEIAHLVCQAQKVVHCQGPSQALPQQHLMCPHISRQTPVTVHICAQIQSTRQHDTGESCVLLHTAAPHAPAQQQAAADRRICLQATAATRQHGMISPFVARVSLF